MTTIGPTLVIAGDITSHEDITVHGRVKGHVRMQEGSLLVAPKGHIDGDVSGGLVTIHGTVAGDVAVTGRVELTPTADVTGTLTARAIVLQEGATFNGLVDMPQRGAATGKGRPATDHVGPRQAAQAH